MKQHTELIKARNLLLV